MASEFERHIGMDPDDTDQPKASRIYSEAKGRIGEASQRAGETIRDSPGTFATMALVIGTVGFALGWICGQASARSERYWH